MPPSSVISKTLVAKLKVEGTSDVIIKMARSTKEVLDALEDKHFANREERGKAESQKHIKDFLDAQTPPIKYQSTWIDNTLFVDEATLDLVKKIEVLGGIKKIREVRTFHVDFESAEPSGMEYDNNHHVLQIGGYISSCNHNYGTITIDSSVESMDNNYGTIRIGNNCDISDITNNYETIDIGDNCYIYYFKMGYGNITFGQNWGNWG